MTYAAESLFDVPATGLVRNDAPDTSREAASRLSTAKRDRVRIFDFIKSRGDAGATDLEIQEALGIEGSSQRPRRVELVNWNAIRDSGQRRKTPTGRQAIVWVVV